MTVILVPSAHERHFSVNQILREAILVLGHTDERKLVHDSPERS